MTYEAQCMERDDHRCFKCGRFLSVHWPGYSCHHRQSRSVGPDTLDNRIMLCGSGTTGCHGEVHKQVTISRENGWIVSRHTLAGEITNIPVTHYRLGPVLLTPDGRLDPARPGLDLA